MKIREFFSKEIEFEFLEKEQLLNPPFIRRAFFLFIILYAFFAVTDLTYYPDNWQILFIIRFAIVIPLLVLVIVLTFITSLAKFHQYYIAFSFFVGGAGIAYMLILHPENIIYYGGLFMVYFSGYLLIRLRFYYAIFSGFAIFLFHSIGHVIINNGFSDTVLFGSLFFIGANLIGMVGAYQFEVKNRKQFLFEKEIMQKNRELTQQYEEKEEQFLKLEKSINENNELISKNIELDLLSKSLKDSEERFRILHNASFGGIALHDKGLILDCNQGLSDITGYSMEELIGMDGLLLIAPDYRGIVREKIAMGYEKAYEVFGIRRNEEIYPIKLEAKNMIYDDKQIRIVEFRDITELKQKENLLIESERKFRTLFEQAPFGYQSLDENGYFIDINKKWLKILGYQKEEVIGKCFGDFLIPDMKEQFKKRFEIFKERGNIYSEFSMKTKNDEIILVGFDGNVSYDENHKFIQTHCTVTDITEISIANNKLIQSEEQYRLLTSEMQLGLALHEIICDNHGTPIDYRIIEVNASYERLTGFIRKDIIGKRILQLLPNISKDWIKTVGEVALTGESTKFEHYEVTLGKHFSTSIFSPKKGRFAVVSEDITEKKKQEELVDYSLKHDSLTELSNRHYYEQKLIELDIEENYPLAIIMMDINGLKLINDSFGQEAGNKVLRQFATILSEEKQKNDFIARVSGDEFVMLSPNTSTQEVLQFKQRLLDIISKQRINNIKYSIAIGFDIKNTKKQEIFEIAKEAENAMYKNKIVYGQGTRSEAIESVFSTLTSKYEYEKIHSERVAKYSKLIGEQLNLREDEIDELELAGRLHDIGKIAISDDIIMKPGKLNDEEWKKVKDHTVIGYQILRAADKYSNLAEYAMSHHERIDGKGYPNGLSGDEIPLFARIICVADAYEAMTSDRTYRKAMKKEEAIKELKKHAGTQFDTKIADMFILHVLNESQI